MPAAFDGTAFQAIERPLALAVDHRLPAACCLLPAACCLLPAACGTQRACAWRAGCIASLAQRFIVPYAMIS
ncbi:hypothetical protein [Xanthomonas oryzae]|uniref:Uncharacterized protein n=1 Tax=Xanthomonas oryzae pv. oryzae TaxID=64187 RepID=A0A854CJU1_XANOO|nr:hypothetical protein [Xanthomonas oryzae]AXQ74067.1 hypothetical protein BXU03_03465 [Xanthomonas oryzae pv. oryzae]OLG69706.1 hypothetical protein BXO554_13760 [Xanthomonas oryzae pv. oryzae]OLH04345.1 hypothetical protein BXO589_10115 [Xanthomonas oryzae pv. oryzae]OLH26434.1 hypothetical protein BXO590_01115 [Xanthomonas oryzae pv. oryzae]OLH29853.1 hypothetical protein DXO044_02025 [Xanthomonas oryzae pv. oryzae]